MAWHRVAALVDLPEGAMRRFEVADEQMLLVRRGAGVHAFGALCPHKFTLLGTGPLMPGPDGAHVECPLHNAVFSLVTGQPAAGQAWAGRLTLYRVRIEAGYVEVDA